MWQKWFQNDVNGMQQMNNKYQIGQEIYYCDHFGEIYVFQIKKYTYDKEGKIILVLLEKQANDAQEFATVYEYLYGITKQKAIIKTYERAHKAFKLNFEKKFPFLLGMSY